VQPASSRPPSDFSSDPQYQQFLEWQAQGDSASHPDYANDPQYRQFLQFQQFLKFQQWQQAQPQQKEDQQQKEQLLNKLQSQLEQIQQQRTSPPAPPQPRPKPTADPYQQIMAMAHTAPQSATPTRRLPIGLLITVLIIALLVGGILYLIFGLPHANLVVASYQNYTDSSGGSGDLHFIGVLKNTGNGDASNATVNLVLKDSKGRQDGNGDDSLFGSKLGPGQTVGFDISILEPPGNWTSVEFSTKTEDSSLSPATGLQVSHSAIASDQNGFVITGTVQNSGQNDAARATIVVTAYDAAGAVVAVATGYSDSRDGIDSGQSDSFTTNIYRKDIRIARYDTFVYADAK
jgi:hypothetical protein